MSKTDSSLNCQFEHRRFPRWLREFHSELGGGWGPSPTECSGAKRQSSGPPTFRTDDFTSWIESETMENNGKSKPTCRPLFFLVMIENSCPSCLCQMVNFQTTVCRDIKVENPFKPLDRCEYLAKMQNHWKRFAVLVRLKNYQLRIYLCDTCHTMTDLLKLSFGHRPHGTLSFACLYRHLIKKVYLYIKNDMMS